MKDRRTVEYAGKFDTTGIIDGLKRIRNELSKTVNSNEGKSALGNIDKQISQLEKASISMKSALEKGFSSTSEMKAFEKELDKIYSSALQVKNGLQAVSRVEIGVNTKNFEKDLKNIEREVKNLKNDALSELIKIIKTSQVTGKQNLALLAQEGKLTKDVLDDEIDKKQKILDSQKEQLKITKQQIEAQQQYDAALNAVGGKNLGQKVTNRISDYFEYGKASKGYDNSIRIKGKGSNYTQKFTDSAGAVLNTLYKDALAIAIQNPNETERAAQAIDIFKEKLEKFNITLKNENDLYAIASMHLQKMKKTYEDNVNNIDKNTIANNSKVKAQEKIVQHSEQELKAYELIGLALDAYCDKLDNADNKLQNFLSTSSIDNSILEQLNLEAEDVGNNINEWSNAAHAASEGLEEITDKQQRLNDTFDGMKAAVVTLLSIGNIFMQMRQEISKTYEDIKELDKAFGQIAMVTEFSIEDMWNKYDAYAKIANELGQSTLSVVQASGLYFQQGLEEAEALELTTSTMKLATLAGLDFEQATSLMTSAVRGFHMEMSQGEHVTDVYSELAAHAAASVNDIATAMSRTAAIANSAGMEFETTSAMLTTMIEATQESPETLGTAMKTVVARFTELKNNVSDTESEFEDLDYNKVDKALKSIGVALKDTNGQFRDIDEVFLEVAEKWDTLDRNSQRYVATIAAGSRQQSRFIALMENYDRTLELIDTAQDSAGRSSEQFAKYQDTLENKVNRLRNSWEQLKLSFISSDMFKGGVDVLNKFITNIGKIDKKRLAAIGIIGITAGKAIILNFINTIKGSTQLFMSAGKTISDSIANYIVQNGPGTKIISAIQTQIDKPLMQIAQGLYNSFVAAPAAGAEQVEKLIADLLKVEREINDCEKELNDNENAQIRMNKLVQEQVRLQGELRTLTNNQINDREFNIIRQAANSNINNERIDRSILATNFVKSVGPIVSSGISTAITTGLMMGLSGADFKDTLTTVGISTLTTTLPQILNSVLPLLGNLIKTIVAPQIGAALTAAAPVLIPAALFAGIAVAGMAIFDHFFINTEEKIDNLKKKAEIIQKELATAESKYNDAIEESKSEQDKLDKIKEIKDTYDELTNKVIKTTEEQEEYNELVETIRNDYPEINSYYDETTKKLKIQNEEWGKIIGKQEESLKLAAQKRLEEGLSYQNLQKQNIQTENQLKRTNLRNASSNFGDYYEGSEWEAAIKPFEKYYKNLSTWEKILQGIALAADFKNIVSVSTLAYAEDSLIDDITTNVSDIIKEGEDRGYSNEQILSDLEDAGFDSSIAAEVTKKNLSNQEDLADLLNMLKNNTEEYDELLNQYEQNLNREESIQLKRLQQQRADEYTAYAQSVYGESEAVSAYYGRKAAEADFNFVAFEELEGKWDELSKQQQDAIEVWFKGLDEETLKNYGFEDYQGKNISNVFAQLTTKDDGTRDAIMSQLNAVLMENLSENLIDTLQKTTSASDKKNIEDFANNLESYTLDELYNKSLPAIKTVAKLDEQFYNDKIEYQQSLADNLKTLTGDDYSKVSLEDLEAWNSYWNNIADLIGSAKTEELASQLKGIQGNLSDELFMLLTSSIDWQDVNGSNLEYYQEQFIKTWEDAGAPGGEKAATAFFNSWKDIEADNDIYQEWFSSGAQIEAYKAQVQSLYDIIKENNDAFADFFATNDTWIKGDLDAIDSLSNALQAMKDAGAIGIEDIENYYKVVNGEVKVNAAAIRKIYEDNIKGHTDYLKKLQGTVGKFNSAEDVNIYLNSFKRVDIHNGSIVTEYNDEAKQIAKWWKQSGENIEEFQKLLSEGIDDLEKMEDLYSSTYNLSKNINITLENSLSPISNIISSYKTLADEMRESGHLTESNISAFNSSLKDFNNSLSSFGYKTKDLSMFLYEENGAIKLNSKALREYITNMIASIEADKLKGKTIDEELLLRFKALKLEMDETVKAIDEANKEAWDTYNENVKSKYEEWQEALEKIKEKEEAVAEAEEKVKEAEEKLLETEEKLQEIYYGEEHHKNKNDYLYNYNVELEQLEERISRVKEALDDMQPGDNAHEKVQEYIDALREEITVYKAQNEVIKQYIENQKQMLDSKLSERLEQLKAEGAVDTSTNVSDFYYERNGRFYIDYQKLNAAKLPDDIADFIEEQVENMNNYAEAYEENLDKISDAEKEFRERQKKARDEYLNTENKVVELLKKKDQEELDSLKEKYDGMKEADDEYTDALEKSIKKQRDLRNQANQWDDLAEKEKKLSLQQRDTSGANAKEIKKTQEDIAKTRESLLDNAVDNIINNLKELYAEQEETRQAEIEYRQAILDNKNYVDEATAIINNWGSVEEAKAWFMQFDEEFINASDATIDKLLEDYEGYYNNTVMYNEWMSRSYEEVTNQTAEEIQEKTRETSETLTSETDRALDEIMEDVHEAQEQGRKDVEEAKKAVAEAKEAVVKAVNEVSTAMEEARKKWLDYQKTLKEPPYTEPPHIEPEPNPNNNPNTPGPSNYDTNQLMGQYFAQHPPISSTKIQDVIDWVKKGNGNVSFNDVIQYIKEHVSSSKHGYWDNIAAYYTNDIPQWAINKGQIFKTGGLVDYTGPAWVDGTPSNPEAFLSATDTRLIREFIDLATLQLNPTEYQNNITSNHTIGDQAFNININVESISSDYDVDQMIERMHEDILSITNEPGSSVMLHK